MGREGLSAVADLGGRPYGPKFSQFHAVFRKIWQNHMLAPPRRVGAASYGESRIRPWFSSIFFFIFMQFLSNNRLYLQSGAGSTFPGKSWIRHQVRSKIEEMNLSGVNIGGSRISSGGRVAPTYDFGKFSQKLHEIEISVEIGCPRWIRPFHRKLALGNRLLEKMLPPFLK